jgi:hypothetical protein
MAVIGCAGTGRLYEAIPLDNTRRPAQDASFNEAISTEVYEEARRVDRRRQEGAFLLSAGRIAKRFGLVGGVRWINSLDDLLNALQHHAVAFGGIWYSSFDEPDNDGLVLVGDGATPRMGHAYTIDELDVENELVGCTNSWGTDWGVSGRFYLPWSVVRSLLYQNGEAVAFVPVLGVK